MPYQLLLTDDTLQSALRRIADEELSAILANFSTPMTAAPKAVHDTRKRIKKLRSLIRLLRDGFDDHAKENAALRDAASTLSGLRDRAVMLATFDTLMARPDAAPDVADLRRLLGAWDTVPEGSTSADPAATLAAVHQRARRWKVDGDDAKLLLRGLSKTRRRGCMAMRLVRRDPQSEAFHDWRKRTKDLWYQSRILSPIWPEVMKPLTEAADLLGETLGHHHDLSVLAERAANLPPDSATARARDELAQRIAEAQSSIEAKTFAMGARLFAGDPEEIARQWVTWWKCWRDQVPS
jgi:CHAD domain-containing protein